MRRLDIGMISYRNPQKLERAIEAVRTHSTTDWRLLIFHNPSGDLGTEDAVKEILVREHAKGKVVTTILENNLGYPGAMNEFFRRADTEYLAYLDNDAEVQTYGWDEQLTAKLDAFHEIGMIFPNGGTAQIDRGQYVEVMWGVGFCFVINRMAAIDTGFYDEEIGHQEDPDYCLRLRMAGWKCATTPSVKVLHHATATSDPNSIERINRGVVNFVNKWNRYFNGKNFNYHSTNVTRWDDWPPNALYWEEYYRLRLPTINQDPEQVEVDGRKMDLIKVPRYEGFYRGRII